MLCSCVLALFFGQDPPAPPPLPTDGQQPKSSASSTLVPGALPLSATPAARERFQALCQATRTSKTPTKPVLAFDLWLDVRVSSEGQSNEALKPLRYRWASPGFVRFSTTSERELLRGPKGDFLLDPTRQEVLPLVGRELAEDRRQLEEWADLSRNFVSLSDPANLRLEELKVLEGPSRGLPSTRLKEASSLLWLAIVSPDFRLPARTGAKPTDRVEAELGLDPKTLLPRLCLVKSLEGSNAQVRLLIVCPSFRTQNERVVPQEVAIHEWDASSASCREKPSLEFWLKKNSSFEPSFDTATFLPPTASSELPR